MPTAGFWGMITNWARFLIAQFLLAMSLVGRRALWQTSFAVMLLVGWSGAAHAGPSTECPPTQSMSVASGGSAIGDNSDCSVFGYDGAVVQPSHGSLTGASSGTGILTYVNNGDGALSDTFTVLDDSNGTIVFHVKIGRAHV